MKGIDHLVLCGNSLAAMRQAYAGLGFTLTPPARHPFGTQNSLVQLDQVFLELVSLADAAKIPEHAAERFSFAAFNRDFLERQEGFSMLVLDSADARADVAAYRKRGLKTYEPFDFSRRARLPGGEDVVVGFSLAFVSSPDMPLCGFFCCQQHAPEHFWQEGYQRHENGARIVSEVVLVAAEPHRLKSFLEHFSGVAALSGEGLRLRTRRGDIAVETPKSFEKIYGLAAPDLSRGPRFGGYTIGLGKETKRPDLLGRTFDLFGTAVRFAALPVAAGTRRD
jgi:Glyoxalase-like domain